MSATCQSLTGAPDEPDPPATSPLVPDPPNIFFATTISRKSSGRFSRALICTTRS